MASSHYNTRPRKISTWAPEFHETNFRDVPTLTVCPGCRSTVVTKTWFRKKKSTCCPCVIHPTLIHIFKDTMHSCPRCSIEIASFNRFWINFRKKHDNQVTLAFKQQLMQVQSICVPITVQTDPLSEGNSERVIMDLDNCFNDAFTLSEEDETLESLLPVVNGDTTKKSRKKSMGKRIAQYKKRKVSCQ